MRRAPRSPVDGAPLGLVEQRQLTDQARRVGERSLEQPHVVAAEALDRGRRRTGRCCTPRPARARRRPPPRRTASGRSATSPAARRTARRPSSVERSLRHVGAEHLEDGMAAEVALESEPGDDLLKRRVLVRDRPQHDVAHLRDQLARSWVRPARSARSATVLANRPTPSSSSGLSRPEVVAPTMMSSWPLWRCKEHVVDRQQRCERRRPRRPGEARDGGRQLAGEPHPVGRAAVVGSWGRARSVGRSSATGSPGEALQPRRRPPRRAPRRRAVRAAATAKSGYWIRGVGDARLLAARIGLVQRRRAPAARRRATSRRR